MSHFAAQNRNDEICNDLTGENYRIVLARIHQELMPKTYFEIGVNNGSSLMLSKCHTIGVDPAYEFADIDTIKSVGQIPILQLFRMRSDDFFFCHSPKKLFGRPVDFAFLDGMHQCEYLMRDFMNIEKHCKKNSIIALHDCLPVESAIAARKPWGEDHAISDPGRRGMWTGDVWRFSRLLKRHRPDLKMVVVDAYATGLVLVTNLDSNCSKLADNYRELQDEMHSWNLNEIGLASYHKEMDVISTSELFGDLDRHFWL
jgi:hypothetical protein